MRKKYDSSVIAFAALFLINPIMGILGTALYSWVNKKDFGIKLLMVLIMCYLSALNTTKVPFDDMIVYLNMFNRVPQNGLLGTLNFWSGSGNFKDPSYSLLVYVLHYITFGNQYLFIFIVTFLEYWLLFMAIYKFSKEYKLPSYIILTQVFVLGFFTQYFSLTFHLTRQILATSVFFYAITFRRNSLLKYIVLCVISMTIHSMTAILVFFSIIPFMQRKLKWKEVILLTLFTAFSITILSNFASFVLETFEVQGALGGSVTRVVNMEGETDTTSGLNQMLGIVFSILFIILCFMESQRNEKMAYPIVINLGLIIAMLILSLSASPLIQNRFFFFLYSILPFLFPLLMRRNVGLSKIICVTTSIFLVVRFFMTYDHFIKYVPADEALLYPFFLLIKIA